MAAKMKIGWDEGEKAEFSKALKQPLMVQTPLQVILETLFSRIQSQASLFSDIQKRIERIEARDINGAELLARIRMCEESLAVINHDKLSPFHQQEVLQRLEDVEAQVQAIPAASALLAQGSTPAHDVSLPPSRQASRRNLASATGTAAVTSGTNHAAEQRLAALEDKLVGVYNLNGKLIALEAMANELGVDIPDTQYVPGEGDRTGGQADQGSTGRGEDGEKGGVSFHPTANVSASPSTSPRLRGAEAAYQFRLAHKTLLSGQAPSSAQSRNSSPDSRAGADGVGSRSGGGVLRLSDVLVHVRTLAADAEDLKGVVGTLREQLDGLSASVAEESTAVSGRVAVLEASGVEMREAMMSEVAAVKKEINRAPEVSFADFTALSSRLDKATAELAGAGDGVRELREKQVLPVVQAVSDIRDQIKVLSGPRDMDTLFHSRITKLEGSVGDIKSEVQLAVQDVLEDVVRLSDLNSIEEAIDSRAAQSDLRQLAMQQANLAQSINGMAEWLSVRPETADGVKGSGASATRFKCLTCDREIKTQLPGLSTSEIKARGSFLPKLENLPPSHGGAPMGPGVNAAEARRLADEKMAGIKSGSPIRGTDFDDYGQEDSKRISPGRVRSGRTAIPMTNNSIMPKTQAGQHRTPIFL